MLFRFSIPYRLKRLRSAHVLAALATVAPLFAQSPAASLEGRATDPSGADIPRASVQVSGPDGPAHGAITDIQVRFRVAGLPAEAYRVRVRAAGFASYESASIALAAGQLQMVQANQSKEASLQRRQSGVCLGGIAAAATGGGGEELLNKPWLHRSHLPATPQPAWLRVKVRDVYRLRAT